MNRCAICDATSVAGRLTYVRATGLWFCVATPDCNYRARRRLGISDGMRRGLRAAEWRAVIETRPRRAA